MITFRILLSGLVLIGIFGCTSDLREVTTSLRRDVGSAPQIIGGENADPELAASTVGIVDNRTGEVICTGSMISADAVLTAGHCVVGSASDLSILFSSEFAVASENQRAVVQVRVTDEWAKRLELGAAAGGMDRRGDLALLKFAGSVPEGRRPVQRFAAEEQVAENAVVLGFGYTDAKMKTRPAFLQQTILAIKKHKYSATETQFAQTSGRGACKGDSGGPTFLTVNGEWVLFGVSSQTGAGCVGPYGYAIVTRVAEFCDWINTVLADWAH